MDDLHSRLRAMVEMGSSGLCLLSTVGADGSPALDGAHAPSVLPGPRPRLRLRGWFSRATVDNLRQGASMTVAAWDGAGRPGLAARGVLESVAERAFFGGVESGLPEGGFPAVELELTLEVAAVDDFFPAARRAPRGHAGADLVPVGDGGGGRDTGDGVSLTGVVRQTYHC